MEPADLALRSPHLVERRTFMAMIGGGLFAAPFAAAAQQAGKVYTVGLVSVGTDPAKPVQWQPFLDAMRELGYVKGQNLAVQQAFGNGRPERLPALVAAVVHAKVDVIVTTGTRETQAVRQATATIPIVMLVVPDPVAQGFVASLARPGGNITGLTNLIPGLSQKYVELLKEVLPSASRFAVISTPPNPVPENRRELEAAVKVLGMSVSFLPVRGPEDFEAALIRAKREGATGIIATADPVTFLHRRTLVGLALQYRLAGIYWTREFVEDGGLMTYSASFGGLRRRAAIYVDKILKGAKPADLPVEQPTKFELVINLKTAKTLGLTIPQSLLARADDVIQ
jgi:putative ABC transport system substrate-binding protein